MLALSADIKSLIFLHVEDVTNLAFTCKTLNNFLKKDKVWLLKIRKEYPDYVSIIPNDISKLEFYKRLKQRGDLTIIRRKTRTRVSDVLKYIRADSIYIIDILLNLFIFDLNSFNINKCDEQVRDIVFFKEKIFTIHSDNKFRMLNHDGVLYSDVKKMGARYNELLLLTNKHELYITRNCKDFELVDSNVKNFTEHIGIVYLTYNGELKQVKYMIKPINNEFIYKMISVMLVESGVHQIFFHEHNGLHLHMQSGKIYTIDREFIDGDTNTELIEADDFHPIQIIQDTEDFTQLIWERLNSTKTAEI